MSKRSCGSGISARPDRAPSRFRGNAPAETIGVGLLMALRFANISVGRHFRAYWPYLVSLVIGLLLLIVFPEITLFLPRRAGLVR